MAGAYRVPIGVARSRLTTTKSFVKTSRGHWGVEMETNLETCVKSKVRACVSTLSVHFALTASDASAPFRAPLSLETTGRGPRGGGIRPAHSWRGAADHLPVGVDGSRGKWKGWR